MYYNTTNIEDKQLTLFDQLATKQEHQVYEAMKLLGKASPSLIHRVLELNHRKKYPITSVRRAIHDLTDSGKLIKTNEQITGDWGRPESVWMVNVNQMNQNYGNGNRG